MIIELTNTNSNQISSQMVKARREIGFLASGMVLSLVVPTDPRHFQKAMDACVEAGREHPSRILLVVTGTSKRSSLNAEVHIGEGVPGEIIVLRLSGEVAEHPESVVLPLLLPDSPVVTWWPGAAPHDPGEDPLGRIADRRITDATAAKKPLEALEERARHHKPGDTDLTWTRLTPWRLLLAASLDQYPAPILGAEVEAPRDNAPASLLAAWLEARLQVPVRRVNSRGPGITAVRMTTPAGDIAITRNDGTLASYLVPGQPKRLVALRRRDINQLLAEELRRMDVDDIFDQASKQLLERARRARGEATEPAPTSPVIKGSANQTPHARAAAAQVADAEDASGSKSGRRTSRTTTRRSAAKKSTAKKTSDRSTAKKATTTKKAAAKKTAAKKSAAQKSGTARSTAKKSAPRKSTGAPAKKATTSKAAANASRAAVKRSTASASDGSTHQTQQSGSGAESSSTTGSQTGATA